MKVAIYSRGLDFEQENPIQLLLEELMQHETKILIFHQLMEQFSFPQNILEKLTAFYNSADLSNDIDILISLGGDGFVEPADEAR